MTLHSAFRLDFTGVARSLVTEVEIIDPFNDVNAKHFSGVWDTGATTTAISQAVIEALKLKPTGKAEVNTASTKETVDTYFIDVKICSGQVGIQKLTVTGARHLAGCDMLIGMDIISIGDFVICNHGGKTMFSFSVPAHENKVDLVERSNKINKRLGKKIRKK